MGKLYKSLTITICLLFVCSVCYGSPKAKRVRIADSGGYYTGTEVETALQEVGDGTTLNGTYLKLDCSNDPLTGSLDITGDLTVSGDDITMATNTTGHILVADGTNYNPVDMSGDVDIDSTGATTIQADSVALTTDTTGNYVASVTNGTYITGGDGGSEAAALTLDVMVAKDLVTTTPITGGVDNILPGADTDITISINNAAADDTTKGACTFEADDFIDDGSGKIDLDYANGDKASTTAPGFLTEMATAAEINTGTDNVRAISPDGFAGSNAGIRYAQMVCFDFTTDVSTGDGKFYIHIPAGLDGMDLVEVHGEAITAGTTGTMDVQIANVTDVVDMLSTKLTWDSTETGTDTAAIPYVIDTTKDDVAENDVIRIDVDAVQTTAAKGMIITLGFRTP